MWGDAGFWLSVDPLVDKYLWISPYAYCNWNPVKYVDPDGNAVHVAVGAVVGAVVGATISGIAAMGAPDTSGRKVLGAIAGGALSGAITGGVAALTGGASLIHSLPANVGAGFVGEALGAALSQEIETGTVDCIKVTRAGIVGIGTGLLSAGVSKGVEKVVESLGVVSHIEANLLNGVKSGTGKVAKQQANQTRKAISTFCNPKNANDFQMQDLITYPTDVVGQEVLTGITTDSYIQNWINE